MADAKQLDASTLRAFENAAAGHDGVLSDPSGELLIKPCTQAEIDFYQTTLAEHPDFAEMMPTFMGTLSLGMPAHAPDALAVHAAEHPSQASQEASKDRPSHGGKIKTETAIVLENLEHDFRHANVLDLKLGSRLYAPGTASEKAERLDKVASDTTSASLNFRVAGMKVWNGQTFEKYDKFYGRKFSADNVHDAFATFFAGLAAVLKADEAQQVLETILAEVTKVRHMLEKYESRMFSASLLLVYEGDGDALSTLMGAEPKIPKVGVDERAPTEKEVKQSLEEEEEEEEGDGPPVAFKVRMIDFAHAAWTPGEGKDENVIIGLKNIEEQMDELIARFDS